MSRPSIDSLPLHSSEGLRLSKPSAFQSSLSASTLPAPAIPLLLPPGESITCVKFPPHGLSIAVVFGGRIHEYDLVTGGLLQSAHLTSRRITHLEYFPSQPKLAVASEDGKVRVFDTATLTQRSIITMSRKETKSCHCLLLHPSRPVVYFNRSGSSTIHGYDLDVKKELSTKLQAKGRHFLRAAIHRSRTLLASAYMEGGFRVWDIDSNRLIYDSDTFEGGQHVGVTRLRSKSSSRQSASHTSPVVTALHFHPTRPWLLVGDQQGSIQLWSFPAETNPALLMRKSSARSAIYTLRFVRPYNDILSVSINKGVHLWQCPTPDSSSVYGAHPVQKTRPADCFSPVDLRDHCGMPGAKPQLVDALDQGNDVFLLSTADGVNSNLWYLELISFE